MPLPYLLAATTLTLSNFTWAWATHSPKDPTRYTGATEHTYFQLIAIINLYIIQYTLNLMTTLNV